ncbi:MFS transporter [Psychrobacillus sp. NPDC096426]|uniref:MFS transporter n=1 Tax=Psychrobacillus sp. NPDC096426 TaxID=3364491 RepID=UPI003830DC01
MFPTKSKNFLKFLIVIIAFQDVAAGVAGSIMADLIEAFPDFAPSTVMLIATIPGLFQIVPALFYGKLSTKFTSRSLLFTGLVLFLVGGIMPFFLDNLFLIIVFRGILGLGVGITLPLSIDIITRFFEGRERDFLIGFGTSTIACIGAIFFQLGGGMLADSLGWQYGFLVYLFPIWILAITFLYLPEPEKKNTIQASLKETLFSAPKTVYGFTIGQIFFSMLVFGYVTNISIIIQSEGLGNATEAGLAISLFTFGTLIVGMFFSKLRALMPIQNVPIAVLLTGGGIFACYLSSSLTMIFVGSFIGGMGLGLALPGVLARTSELSNEQKGISFVGFVVAAQGLGGLISPFFYQTILNITGSEGGRPTLLFASLGLAILAIVWSIILITSNSKSPVKDTRAPAL